MRWNSSAGSWSNSPTAPWCDCRTSGTVSLGASSYDNQVWLNGQKSVYIGIKVAPSANLLTVINGVKAVLPSIQADMPHGLTGGIIYNAGAFVQVSLDDLFHTLAEAVAIVTLVVFVFLGSFRSLLIPVVAVPVSLIGTLSVMLAFGFSINLLTLLALVLAIGLVVDDVIIMVENAHRHIEEGMGPTDAALRAARDLGRPILAMTIVLIAVYVPIGLQGGLTGALFTEFAFTLAAAVTLSGVVALTLSPMMCARMLRPTASTRRWDDRMSGFVQDRFARLRLRYERRLRSSLQYRPVTYVFAGLVLCSIYFLYSSATSELAPQEDQGIVLTTSLPAPSATLEQRELYSRQHYRLVRDLPELDQFFQIDVPGTSINGIVLKPWDERTRTANMLQAAIQARVNQIAGERVVAFQPPTLPGSSGLPVQFVLTTTRPFSELNVVADRFLRSAQQSGVFAYVDCDLKIDQPQFRLRIDPDRTALLGLHLSDVGSGLAAMLSGGYVNYFSMAGRAYQVIPQVRQESRLNPSQLLDYFVRTASGVDVPLSTVATLSPQTVPEQINHFQQFNSATISGVPAPGLTVGDALGFLQKAAATDLPQGFGIDYGGQSQQFVRESHGFATLFAFALILIFLALSAQFNSFRDPFIILVSVPMSIAGALAVHQYRPWRCHAEHLHRGRTGDADRIDQQAWHPDCRVRQRAADARSFQAGGRRGGGRHPPPTDPHDHGRDGAGRPASCLRERRRRRGPFQHRDGDHDRYHHRHVVHPVRGACLLRPDGGTTAAAARGRHRRPPGR